MLTKYIEAAMALARFQQLEGDEGVAATIPGFEGLWAHGDTRTSCELELRSTLEDWLLLSLTCHMPIPVVDGIDLTVREVA